MLWFFMYSTMGILLYGIQHYFFNQYVEFDVFFARYAILILLFEVCLLKTRFSKQDKDNEN
jgi:hypothetical protein